MLQFPIPLCSNTHHTQRHTRFKYARLHSTRLRRIGDWLTNAWTLLYDTSIMIEAHFPHYCDIDPLWCSCYLPVMRSKKMFLVSSSCDMKFGLAGKKIQADTVKHWLGERRKPTLFLDYQKPSHYFNARVLTVIHSLFSGDYLWNVHPSR